MGLDMFLYVKTSNYFSKWWKGSEPKDYEYPEVLKFFETDIGRESSASVEVTKKFKIAYWRKFNALHGHISSSYYEGDGEYKGQNIVLTKENIEEMLKLLKEIDEEPGEAPELMPTTSGFFFGSLDYDDWYFHDVAYTIIVFENLLKVLETNPEYEVIYGASW